jgi:hypothetical protein
VRVCVRFWAGIKCKGVKWKWNIIV